MVRFKSLAVGRLLAQTCVVAMAVVLATPGGPRVIPGRGLVPNARAVPAPRVMPTPRLDSSPLSPGLRSPSGSGQYNTGANCRARCGSTCQTAPCSGLNVSQCLSERQRCRMSCSSRC